MTIDHSLGVRLSLKVLTRNISLLFTVAEYYSDLGADSVCLRGGMEAQHLHRNVGTLYH